MPGLHLIAEDVLGAETRIDFVGVEPTGRVVLILLVDTETEPGGISAALAQRAWVEPRVRDWIQLAPNSGVRPGAGVRVVLLGSGFSSHSEAAAATLGPECVSLGRYRCLRNGADLHILLEPARPEAVPAAPIGAIATTPAPAPIAAAPQTDLPPFRTGLTDEDLGLTPEADRALE